MKIEILSTAQEYETLRKAWNNLVQDDPRSMLGLDATSTYEWFETILAAFPEAADSRVIVLWENNEIVGILPVIIDQSSRLGPKLLVPTETYGGRNGPLLSRSDPELLRVLLGGLNQACPGWISLQCTVVSGSESEELLSETCKNSQYKLIGGGVLESPFFPIHETRESFETGITKGLRQLLRTSSNKFKSLGELNHKAFTNEADANQLLDIVFAIERKSWKHAAGTAITTNPRQERFYVELFPRAMKSGLLHAQVLILEDKPIAYNFGLCNQNVFSCLKHSHDQTLDKLSPSYLVNLALIDNLRNKGVVGYDFMGRTEPHKLRWSNSSGLYKRRISTIYNKNIFGRMNFHLKQINGKIENLKSSKDCSENKFSD